MRLELVPARAARRVVRVLVTDDHELARAGLKSLLAGERGLEVVGEAASGAQAVSLCQRLQPNLVLMDVRMPDMDGLAATREIKARCPATSVIIVTMHENPDYLLEAIKAGAAGYLLKGATKHELLTTIRQVMSGEPVLNADLTAQLLRRLAGEQAPAPSVATDLTPREQDVLREMTRGLTNRQIANELVVSLSTVKAHVEHIIAKLGVSDRTQAAVRAVELGLLPAARR